MRDRFVHSIKICLIVWWFPHGHLGGGSSFRIKSCVNLVCPIRSRERMVSSFLVLLASRFLSFGRGSIWRSLFWAFSSHNCCHLFVIICLILCFKSVYGSFEVLSGGMLIATLANESALSFPWIPIWPGIQQNMIFCSVLGCGVCLIGWRFEGYRVFGFL